MGRWIRWGLRETLTRLQELDVGDNNRLTAAGLRGVAAQCTGLTAMRLGNGNEVGAGLVDLLHGCRGLRRLTVGYGNAIDDAVAAAAAEHLGPALLLGFGEGNLIQ